jgi:hypothetical protein
VTTPIASTLDALRHLLPRLKRQNGRARLDALISAYEQSIASYGDLLLAFNLPHGSATDFDDYSAFKTLTNEQEHFTSLVQEIRALRESLS